MDKDNFHRIPEILENELSEIIKNIAVEYEIQSYINDPYFLEERLYAWHQFGLLEHTKKVRSVFSKELDNFLEKLDIKSKVDEILNQKIDNVEKKILFEISIPLHDLGKILVYKDERKDREHEFISKQLIEQGFLKEKLKEFGLTENQLKYIGEIIETHDVLGKKVRDELKHAGNLKLDYISEQSTKELCKNIVEKYPEIKIEIGIFFLCDVLGKTDVRMEIMTDEDLLRHEKEIEQELKERNLPPELKKAIMQLPVNMKLGEVYLRNITE